MGIGREKGDEEGKEGMRYERGGESKGVEVISQNKLKRRE